MLVPQISEMKGWVNAILGHFQNIFLTILVKIVEKISIFLILYNNRSDDTSQKL